MPVCSCGYQLGQRPNLPPVAEIESLLERGINQYLQAFQEEEYRRRIIPYTLTMEEIGKKAEADSIRQLLDLGEEIGQMQTDIGQVQTDIGQVQTDTGDDLGRDSGASDTGFCYLWSIQPARSPG